jgi:TonB family protein
MVEKSKKKFIKRPTLGGGRELLRKFFREHLRYPEEALAKGIEGDVVVEYRVNSNGDVIEAKVVHGLGYGCDAEALRLVQLLKYQAVSNRGVRVTTNNRMKIPFRLPKKTSSMQLNMTFVPKQKPSEKKDKTQGSDKAVSYTYTITTKKQ